MYKIIFAIALLGVPASTTLLPQAVYAQSAQQANAYYFLAENAYQEDEYDEAYTYLKKAEELRGATDEIFLALEVKILAKQKKYILAKQKLDQFYGYNPSNELQREMAPFLATIDREVEAKAKAEAARLAKIEFEQAELDKKTVWNRTYGGGKLDSINSITLTPDGGALLGGHTNSKGAGGEDMYLVRVDSDGNMLWDQTYGGGKSDTINSITLTPDGGALLGGYTNSNGAGRSDMYLVRVDSDGNMLWDKTYGSNSDWINSITLTPDGGALLGGHTRSKGADKLDMYLVRVDSDGNMLWDQTYGGGEWDIINSITLTPDGGALLGGWTTSKGAGLADMYLVRVDSDGNMLWDQTYGGGQWDDIRSITLTPDGGALLGGYTYSKGAGGRDMYLVRVDSDGNMLWDQTYGGGKTDIINSITLTPDGGALLGGYTASKGAGRSDMYLVRVDSDGNMLWDQTYGGGQFDVIRSIALTPDGGALLGGWTTSKGAGGDDMYLVKIGSIEP